MRNFNEKTIAYLTDKYGVNIPVEQFEKLIEETVSIHNRVPRKQRLYNDLMNNTFEHRVKFFNTVTQNLSNKLRYWPGENLVTKIPDNVKLVGVKENPYSNVVTQLEDVPVEKQKDLKNWVLVFSYPVAYLADASVRRGAPQVARLREEKLEIEGWLLMKDPMFISRYYRAGVKRMMLKNMETDVETLQYQVEDFEAKLEETRMKLVEAENVLKKHTVQAGKKTETVS